MGNISRSLNHFQTPRIQGNSPEIYKDEEMIISRWLTSRSFRDTTSSNLSPTRDFHFLSNESFGIGSFYSIVNTLWEEGWKKEKEKSTLWFLNMPSPTSLIMASTSIFHLPSWISPNQDMICVETALETSWPSTSVVERASTEADACCIERDTRRLSTSSRSVSR